MKARVASPEQGSRFRAPGIELCRRSCHREQLKKLVTPGQLIASAIQRPSSSRSLSMTSCNPHTSDSSNSLTLGQVTGAHNPRATTPQEPISSKFVRCRVISRMA